MTEFEQDVIDRLARIETAASGGSVAQLDHEARIRVLERGAWKMAGMTSVIAALAGALAGVVEPFMKGHLF